MHFQVYGHDNIFRIFNVAIHGRAPSICFQVPASNSNSFTVGLPPIVASKEVLRMCASNQVFPTGVADAKLLHRRKAPESY